MNRNLRTEQQLNELRRQELLAAAARYRVAQGRAARVGARRKQGTLRQWIGAGLVRIGRRLQGTRPIKPIGNHTEGLAPSSA